MIDFVQNIYDRWRAAEAEETSPNDKGPTAPAEVPTDAAEPSPLPTISFRSTSVPKKTKAYELRAEGGRLYLDLRSKKGLSDPRVGELASATILNFRNKRIGMMSPIVLDLDDDGIELRGRKKSNATFDMDGDGVLDDTGWVGRNDGLLVIDRNGDGQITSASELSFLTEDAQARSDLEALAKLDSNGDLSIDSNDERFGELKVWRDRNGNGRSEATELLSLADHNIKSLSLEALAVNSKVKVGSNAMLATSTFTRVDGSRGTIGDVALAFRPSAKGGTGLVQDNSIGVPQGMKEGEVESVERPRQWINDELVAESVRQNLTTQEAPGRDGAERALRDMSVPDSEWSFSPDTFNENSWSGNSALRDSDSYRVQIESANARLVQALATFDEAAPMMMTSPTTLDNGGERFDWLTTSSFPSVGRLMTVG